MSAPPPGRTPGDETPSDTDAGADPEIGGSGEELMDLVRTSAADLREQIGSVVVGQREVTDQILMALFSRGHAMLVGVPGLAKTLLISTISRALDLEFSRVQFTPDLMPSDITGTEVIEEDKASGTRSLRFVRGPIFANVVLADEINRTPPKTQAALLEAMQERQVTAGGSRHALPEPFFVLATQNPLEQEGTYPLPEAQLDRFMLQIQVGYPSEEEELEVIRRSADMDEASVTPVVDARTIAKIQRVVRHVPVHDHVARYALRLVRATRVGTEGAECPEVVRSYVSWGAGPRASESLVQAAKAHALIVGDGLVTIDTVRAVAAPVLRHRIVLNFNAQADQVTPDAVVQGLVDAVPADSMDAGTRRAVRGLMQE